MARAGVLPVRARARLDIVLLAAAGLLLAGVASAGLVERCSWPPPGGPVFRPDSVNVEVAPIVGDLDGDGIPEIIFLSFTDGFDDNGGEDGVLRILSGADCSEVAALSDPGCVSCFGDAACRSLEVSGGPGIFCPGCTPAIADLDGDGQMEIVAITETSDPGGLGRRAMILDSLGNFLSCTEAASEFIGPVAAVALADLESDGSPEILARGVAWRASGEIAWQHPISGIGATIAADLDGDGILEVTSGQEAYRATGELIWGNGLLRGASPAVADLDLDCVPELIVTSRNRQTINVVDPLTGLIRAWASIPVGDCPDRPDGQGGPPTLADVDGDCVPEIGVAGCRRYALYRYEPGPPEALTLMWEHEIDDATSRFTGSAIFDLDGDGTAEVLYNDHQYLRILDGVTGALEAILPNSTNTLMELPVVADVDGDGAAEIVLAANAYSFCCDVGVRVLVDDAGPWAPARPIYNQHSYHVTNILDDGSLPAPEEPSWSRYNTYRSQGPPLRDDAGPILLGVPADASASCMAVPPPPLPSATAGCDESPDVVLIEEIQPGACAGSHVVVRTWTATDRCGRSASATQVLDIVDDEPPSLVAPPDETASCLAPEAPLVTALDACDAAPVVSLAELLVPGPCPLEWQVMRTWTATDACGNEASVTQIVNVVDDGPPSLLGVPEDLEATCLAPAPVLVTAEDACDPNPEVLLDETIVPGPCPLEWQVVRTWTARDACGRETSASQVIDVVDDGPPVLVGVPADAEASCSSVPPPAVVTAVDGCDPSPVVTFSEERIDGSCANEYQLVRTWTATDACGRSTSASQVVAVADLTPPVVTSPPRVECLWPPNHWMVCFGPEDFAVEFEDDCPGEVSWRFVSCASDQPENDLGDGNHAPDCILGEDGRVCVRAERQGTKPEGRTYGIAIVAVDACGNESEPVIVGSIHVPHDQSPAADCLKTTVVGTKNGQRRGE